MPDAHASPRDPSPGDLGFRLSYLEQLFEGSPDAIAVVDEEDRVLRINPSFTRIFGYEPDETVGRPIYELVVPEDRVEEARSLSQRTLGGGSVSVETIRRRKDGSRLWVSIVSNPFTIAPGRTGVYGIYRDITVRKRAQLKLRRRERTLKQFLAAMPLGVFILDARGQAVYANRRAQEILGKGIVAGTGKEDLASVYQSVVVGTDEPYPTERMPIVRALSGERSQVEDLEVVRPDRRVCLEVRGTPIRDRAGNVVYAVATFQDITFRREMQAAERRARAEAERTARSKAEFLANMSHEIRTPMNAVIGMASLLADTDLDAEQRDFLATIQVSGEHLMDVINDILDLSKIEAGMLELDHGPFLLREVAEQAMDLVAAQAAQKQLEGGCVEEEGAPEWILGDAGRLRQVLVNLLSNAVKFTERGHVLVRIRPWSGGDPEPGVELVVEDTGAGIPRERSDAIFEAFEQVDGSSTRQHGGTGLGLAICRRLTEMMGGKIWVESEMGVGSTFHVVIRAPEAERPEIAETEGGSVDLTGLRALIVDDIRVNRTILLRFAGQWGMEAVECDSAGAALDLMRGGESFDVILLDHRMPHMDGLSFAKRLEETGVRPRIVLVTSLDHRLTGTDAVDAVVLKPLKANRVRDTLRHLFGDRRRRRRAPEPEATEPEATVPEARPGGRMALRVLVAEDNAVNQKVIRRMLERSGVDPDLVADGVEAMDALGRATGRPYDVVFLDIQMPRMDGFEVARRVVAESPRDRRPWLVAMTAHVGEEVQRNCREAGMDDYVSKPVRREAMEAALERAVRARPGTEHEAPGEPSEEAGFDSATFRWMAEEMGADRELMADLVNAFREVATTVGEQMRAGLAVGDPERIRSGAHSLKSASAQLGGVGVSRLAAELERDAASGLPTDAAERIDGLQAALVALEADLDRALEEMEG